MVFEDEEDAQQPENDHGDHLFLHADRNAAGIYRFILHSNPLHRLNDTAPGM